MEDRLRYANRKILQSAIQMDKIIADIFIQEGSRVEPKFKNHLLLKQSVLLPSNPEEPPEYIQTKQFGSTRRSMDKSKISSPKIEKHQKERNTNSTDNYKKTQNKDESRSRNRISVGAKISIGQHLYPVSNQIKMSLEKTKNSATQKNHSKDQVLPALIELNHKDVLNYGLSKEPLHSTSSPEQIYDYFQQFGNIFHHPLIKKFKNCLYYGQSSPSNGQFSVQPNYYGFLYFFNQKIYYGGFVNEFKNGRGVEINLKKKIVYKGMFQRGHKIGQFQVYFENMKYEGELIRGKYHGVGRLQTPISIYSGQFVEGMRNGEGQEYFFTSGLKLKGLFVRDKFCNKSQQADEFNKKEFKKEKQKHVNFPRVANIFQFSFHDSSEDEFQHNTPKKTSIKPLGNLYKTKLKQSQRWEDENDKDAPLPSPFRRNLFGS